MSNGFDDTLVGRVIDPEGEIAQREFRELMQIRRDLLDFSRENFGRTMLGQPPASLNQMMQQRQADNFQRAFGPSETVFGAPQGREVESPNRIMHNRLIGAARHYGIPDPEGMELPELYEMVESARLARASEGGPGDFFQMGLSHPGGVLGAAMGAGALSGIVEGVQRIPFIGDILGDWERLQDIHQGLARYSEAVGAGIEGGDETLLELTEGAGHMAGYLALAAPAWMLAGAVTSTGALTGVGLRSAPMWKLAARGGLASWMLEGGGDAPLLHRTALIGLGAALDPAIVRGGAVGAGALGGALGAGITGHNAESLGEVAGGAAIGAAAAIGLRSLARRALASYPRPTHEARSAGFRSEWFEGTVTGARPGFRQRARGPEAPYESVSQAVSDPRAGPRGPIHGGTVRGEPVPTEPAGLLGPGQGQLPPGPEPLPPEIRGLLPEAAEAGPATRARRLPPIPEQSEGFYSLPEGVAVREATAMAKQQRIMESPALPEMSRQPRFDDYDVAYSAWSQDPGGIHIVRGVENPEQVVQRAAESARDLGPHQLVPVEHPTGRMDMLVLSDLHNTSRVVNQYKTFGMFEGQLARYNGSQVRIEHIATSRRDPTTVEISDLNGNGVRNIELDALVTEMDGSGLKGHALEGHMDTFPAYLEAQHPEIDLFSQQMDALIPERINNYLNEVGVTDPTERAAITGILADQRIEMHKIHHAGEEVLATRETINRAAATRQELVDTGMLVEDNSVEGLAASNGWIWEPATVTLPDGYSGTLTPFEGAALGPELNLGENFAMFDYNFKGPDSNTTGILTGTLNKRSGIFSVDWVENQAGQPLDPSTRFVLQHGRNIVQQLRRMGHEPTEIKGYRASGARTGPAARTDQPLDVEAAMARREMRIPVDRLMSKVEGGTLILEQQGVDLVPAARWIDNGEVVSGTDLERLPLRELQGQLEPGRVNPETGEFVSKEFLDQNPQIVERKVLEEIPVESEAAVREFFQNYNQKFNDLDPMSGIPFEAVEFAPGSGFALSTPHPVSTFKHFSHRVASMLDDLEEGVLADDMIEQEIRSMTDPGIAGRIPPEFGGLGPLHVTGEGGRPQLPPPSNRPPPPGPIPADAPPPGESFFLPPGDPSPLGAAVKRLSKDNPVRLAQELRRADRAIYNLLDPAKLEFTRLHNALVEAGVPPEAVNLVEDYTQLGQDMMREHNVLDTVMRRMLNEFLGVFKPKHMAQGTVARISEIASPNRRFELMQEAGFSQAEVEAMGAMRQFFDDMRVRAKEHPQTADIGNVLDYIPHLRAHQAAGRVRGTDHYDPFDKWQNDLPDSEKWFALYAREGNLDSRVIDIRELAVRYVRGMAFEQEVAPTWNKMVQKWGDPRLGATDETRNMQGVMLGWLKMIRYGQDPNSDPLLRLVGGALEPFGITPADVSRGLGGLSGAMYRRFLGGSVRPIARDLIQPLNLIPEVGFRAVGRGYLKFFRSQADRMEMYEYAINNGLVEIGRAQVPTPEVMSGQPAIVPGSGRELLFAKTGDLLQQATPGLPNPIESAGLTLSPERAARRELGARVGRAIGGAMPAWARKGIAGTIKDPLFGYLHVGIMNRVVSAWVGKEAAERALTKRLQEGLSDQAFLQEAHMLHLDKERQRLFLEDARHDPERAITRRAIEAADVQHRYGHHEHPRYIRNAKMTGKLGAQLGTFTIQQLALWTQAMKNLPWTGPGNNKWKYAARLGGLMGGIKIAADKSGMSGLVNWIWMQAFAFAGGPILEFAQHSALAAQAMVQETFGGFASPLRDAARAQYPYVSRNFFSNFNPVGGYIETFQGIAEAQTPFELAEFLLTGQRNPGERLEKQLEPEGPGFFDAMRQRFQSDQTYVSPPRDQPGDFLQNLMEQRQDTPGGGVQY